MKTVRYFNLIIALLLLASFLGVQPTAAAKPITTDIAPDALFVPGEVVVGFTAGQTAKAYTAQASALAGTVGAQVVNQYGNMVVLSFSQDADVQTLAAQLSGRAGVKYAEPNYVYTLPAPTGEETAVTPSEITLPSGDGSTITIPLDTLASPQKVTASVVAPVIPGYPNDPALLTNWGWSNVGADIVWPNTTPSAGVCVVDTGVDYLHPELVASIVKGFDFVNNDADPMDDNGHGTMVAGVISAKMNNGEGIAGVSTGKVVAVKVVNAQGQFVTANVFAGIEYCAGRADVKVINLSGTGGTSLTVWDAVDFALSKGKLIVAAAGDAPGLNFPAALASLGAYANKVLAVAAIDNGSTTSDGCRAAYSNSGDWISTEAPGTAIYSTTPWDKPFYWNYQFGVNARYATYSSTGMAAAFASAIAARRWGYKPTDTNVQVGASIVDGSWTKLKGDGACWPVAMNFMYALNVAYQLQRGGAVGYIRNATTVLPLTGALMQLYQGATMKGSGVVYSYDSSFVQAFNLPIGPNYTAKVNLTGVTAGPQPAFQHRSTDTRTFGSHDMIYGGQWTDFGHAYVPNKSANFDVVAGWGEDYYTPTSGNLDLFTYLPSAPNANDPSQPAKFIVGYNGNAFGQLEGDPKGSLLYFPYAIFNHEGGSLDPYYMESTTISKRLAHGTLAANPALPYYPGVYNVLLYDKGTTFSGHPLMYNIYPFAYLWKDGMIKSFSEYGNCDTHVWYPFIITSGKTGTAPTIQNDTTGTGCSDFGPYSIGSASSFTIGTPPH